MEGVGEERWTPDRTGAPEGGLGEGGGSHAQRGPLMASGSVGTERNLQGIGELEGNAASISPGFSDPGKPAEVLCLNPHILWHPPAMWVLGLSSFRQGLFWPLWSRA